MRECLERMGAAPFAAGSDELNQLEYYLTYLANGQPVKANAWRGRSRRRAPPVAAAARGNEASVSPRGSAAPSRARRGRTALARGASTSAASRARCRPWQMRPLTAARNAVLGRGSLRWSCVAIQDAARPVAAMATGVAAADALEELEPLALRGRERLRRTASSRSTSTSAHGRFRRHVADSRLSPRSCRCGRTEWNVTSRPAVDGPAVDARMRGRSGSCSSRCTRRWIRAMTRSWIAQPSWRAFSAIGNRLPSPRSWLPRCAASNISSIGTGESCRSLQHVGARRA